jgi:magnesium chelatase subunit D
MSILDDAADVACLFAVDPAGLGGVCLRSQVHPVRDQWLSLLRELLPAEAPLRRIPSGIAADRLLGGLDLTATLKAHRPVAERGVLASSDGGVVVVNMAERLPAQGAAHINAALDAGEVVVAREGINLRHDARIGIVALDEGIDDEEHIPFSLFERLAFLVDLNGLPMRAHLVPAYESDEIVAARARLPAVHLGAAVIETLCASAMALGAGATRLSLLACRAACAAAALADRTEVAEEDAILAGRLVLAPRASMVPPAQQSAAPPPAQSDPADPPNDATPPPPSEAQPPQEPRDSSAESESGTPPDEQAIGEMDARVLAAAQAAIPAGLLARLKFAAQPRRSSPGGAGRAGAVGRNGTRGRPAGVRSGPPRGHARLNVIETLRAAAPWQGLRRRAAAGGPRVRIEPSDFRVTHHKQRSRTLTIFAVDASGSAALNRLAEAKGAVELLLADCYIRRDEVAVIAFRGRTAELLLPPTRSLLRAKRGLAGLPGGGGTPLAAAIEAAVAVAALAQRRGDTPTLVLLTDGRANIARDGAAGRDAAHRDALNAARTVRAARVAALFIDTSPRPHALAGEIAAAMNARYLPLPFANSRDLSDIVKAAAAARA